MWRRQEHAYIPVWHSRPPRPFARAVTSLLKVTVPLLTVSLLLIFTFWEPHVEITFYSRHWIKHELTPTPPLHGCFDPARVSPRYNLTDAVYGAKSTVVHAGMPMRLGMDCYDFAGTIPPPGPEARGAWVAPEERTQYHTYWRADLAPFAERQEWMLKSFFATQDGNASRLVLWSNGELGGNALVQKYLHAYPDAFALRVVDFAELSQGTALEGSVSLEVQDEKAWVDGDLLRLLVLWNYGGVWVDMDTLLTRDLQPLLEHEFVTQWDCYDKLYVPFNAALMRFRAHSPYLCEAFHIMAASPRPRAGTTDWGATLYLKLWRRLVAAGLPPFAVLPFCFSDARACRLDNRLPDPFAADPPGGAWAQGMGREAGGGLDGALRKVFSVHLHNQWEKGFPRDGWVRRLLLDRYEEKLAAPLTG